MPAFFMSRLWFVFGVPLRGHVGVNGHALLFTSHDTYLIRSLHLFVPQLLFTNTEVRYHRLIIPLNYTDCNTTRLFF